jgi:3D-(3,5/4)-trihydroxycyclohexane-1,2-dione acylhydrolase (decyclizing)
METVRLTTGQAIVRWLIAQRTEIDGVEVPLFPGVFAIFGHGNVVSLAEALAGAQEELPTWRGHNEQSMALAAVAYAKAKRRRQIMVATSSVGPGSTNMVTAAAVAHADRLPLLLIGGDTFQHRIVDPVLQQVEHFGSPSTTVSDAFRAVTRFWDRTTRPEQIIQTLPQALAIMLDPAECGPAYIGLPQDIAAEAYPFPVRFFDETLHYIRRPGPDPREIATAAAVLAAADKPLLIAGSSRPLRSHAGSRSSRRWRASPHWSTTIQTLPVRLGLPEAPRPTPSLLMPTWLWRWEPASRTSPPDHGQSSRTHGCTWCRSTSDGLMPPNTMR